MEYVKEEIRKAIEREACHILRFCTGELSDSLALDRKYRIHGELVGFFGETKRAILEMKSKWAQVDHLLPVINPYVVVSFSIAPWRIVKEEEKRTSPIEKRLRALRRVQERGCFVGLHFDPIVIYDGFEKDYERLLDLVALSIDLKRVIWVSLGLLRFPPDLFFLLLLERRSTLLQGEFIRGEDGKVRYLKRERIRVYRFLYELLRSKEETLFVYLCMERADVWRQALDIRLEAGEDLMCLFDRRIKSIHGGFHEV
jgi:spore photoproduct lyase